MARIIQFPQSTPSKFGYKKASAKRGRRKFNLEDHGQLNIFEHQNEARVVSLKSQIPPFEEALLCDNQGNHDRAKQLYQDAIKAKEHVADSYCNLGIIFSKEENSTAAIDSFTQCLKEEPRHFEAHYNLANLFSDLGNYPLAKLHYQMSVTINPEFSNGYYNLGLVLATNREFKEAIDAFIKYKDLAPPEEKENAMELIRNIHQSISES